MARDRRGYAGRDVIPIRGIVVRDVLRISGVHGHAPGIAVVLDAFPSPSASAYIGRLATIRRPDGGRAHAAVGDARDHGVTISLFFAGLGPGDVPVGSTITVEAGTRDRTPGRT